MKVSSAASSKNAAAKQADNHFIFFIRLKNTPIPASTAPSSAVNMIPALKFTINAIAAASAISSTPAAAAVTLRTADGLILCALRRELFFFSIIKLGAVVLFFRYRPAHVPADKNVNQHGDKIDHESHAEAYKTIAAFHICG